MTAAILMLWTVRIFRRQGEGNQSGAGQCNAKQQGTQFPLKSVWQIDCEHNKNVQQQLPVSVEGEKE